MHVIVYALNYLCIYAFMYVIIYVLFKLKRTWAVLLLGREINAVPRCHVHYGPAPPPWGAAPHGWLTRSSVAPFRRGRWDEAVCLGRGLPAQGALPPTGPRGC